MKDNGQGRARYLQLTKKQPYLSREEEETLVARWKAGDKAAGARIVQAHLRFVTSMAWSYRSYDLPLEELISEGNIGLLEALTRFDPTRGVRFATYAGHWVRAAMLGAILRWPSVVNAGAGSARRTLRRMKGHRARLMAIHGDEDVVINELAKKFEITSDSVRSIFAMDDKDLSLETPLPGGDMRLSDTLASDEESHEEQLADLQNRDGLKHIVRDALLTLDERERYIIEHRIMASSALTLAEIGQRMSLSRERVRQLESRAKKKLKSRIERRASVSGHDARAAALV